MRHLVGVLVLVMALGAGSALIGCSKTEEEPTNPHLKVPDVPPSSHGSRPVPTKPGAQKK
jgi:hypothetical protein